MFYRLQLCCRSIIFVESTFRVEGEAWFALHSWLHVPPAQPCPLGQAGCHCKVVVDVTVTMMRMWWGPSLIEHTFRVEGEAWFALHPWLHSAPAQPCPHGQGGCGLPTARPWHCSRNHPLPAPPSLPSATVSLCHCSYCYRTMYCRVTVPCAAVCPYSLCHCISVWPLGCHCKQ